MHSVKGDKLVCESRVLFTAVTSLLLSILENILAMSKDTRITLSGIPLAFTVSNMSIRKYGYLFLLVCSQLIKEIQER